MKRRGRKVTGRKPKANAQDRKTSKVKSGKSKPVKSASRSRRPVDPDEDVFIPRSGVAAQAVAKEDDEEVFITKPVLRQSDWVKDVGAPDTPPRDASVWEPFAGIKPKAGSPALWSRAELYAHGLEYVPPSSWRGERVRCRYGCSGTTSNVQGVSHHSYDCAYWTREGMKHTPF